MRGSAMNPSGSFGSLADILRRPRHVRFIPRMRTLAARIVMSALCQKQPWQSFDHFVGARNKNASEPCLHVVA